MTPLQLTRVQVFVARRDQLLPHLHEHVPPVVLRGVTAFAGRVRQLLEFIGQLMHPAALPASSAPAMEGNPSGLPLSSHDTGS